MCSNKGCISVQLRRLKNMNREINLRNCLSGRARGRYHEELFGAQPKHRFSQEVRGVYTYMPVLPKII